MRIQTKDMVLTALFTALMTVGAYITIPIPPVPVSMQTFFCVLSGIILGSKLGAMSQLIYALAGLTGFPVFTQGGGISYIFKPSFGYILGFVLAAYVAGKVSEALKKADFIHSLASALCGLVSIYAVGVPYMYIIMKIYMKKADFTFMSAITAGFAPFIIKDLIMFVVAALLASQIVPSLARAGFRRSPSIKS